MKHLSTEELLLAADGECGADQAAHLEACVACRAAVGQIQGELTTICSSLTGGAPADSMEVQARSWNRLQEALSAESSGVGAHLSLEELLLASDGELPLFRLEHLQFCGDCRADARQASYLLSQVERELRDLCPRESSERRLAALAALRSQLRAAQPKTLVPFPARRVAAYAAAAAAAFVLAGAFWRPQPVEIPASIASDSRIETPPLESFERSPAEIVSGSRAVQPQEQDPSGFSAGMPRNDLTAPVFEPPSAASVVERFEMSRAEARAPRQQALVGDSQPVLAGAKAPALDAPALDALLSAAPGHSVLAALPSPAAPTVPAQEAPDRRLELEGWRLLTRAGFWTEDVEPRAAAGTLTFAGVVESEAAAAAVEAALRQVAKPGSDLHFSLSARAESSGPAPGAADAVLAGHTPAGGAARTALLEHYRDAARRSFLAPSPTLLEAEAARYVSEIFFHQAALLRHASALDRALDGMPAALDADPETARAAADLARFHANAAADHEQAIYDRLSEVLPRKYWNYRGEKRAFDLEEGGLSAEAHALLGDALRLDETLTALLISSPAASLDFHAGNFSAGESLYRIRARTRILKDLAQRYAK